MSRFGIEEPNRGYRPTHSIPQTSLELEDPQTSLELEDFEGSQIVTKAKLSIVAAFVVGALAASFGIVQGVSSPEADAAAAPVMVKVLDMPPGQPTGYEPSEAAVKPGQVVKWRNEGAEAHTATAEDGSFDSGSMAPGAEFQFTFSKPGTISYTCTPHPWAKGTVKVG
jgi:plastocyanin